MVLLFTAVTSLLIKLAFHNFLTIISSNRNI